MTNIKEIINELERQQAEGYIVVYAKKDGEDYLLNWFWTDAYEAAPDHLKQTIKTALINISESL